MAKNKIQDILREGTDEEKKALFQFDSGTGNETIVLKFNIWVRHFYPKFFKIEDAPFHKEIDEKNMKLYRGQAKTFINLAFREAAKTTRTKLFLAFCIANDQDHSRKYIKMLSYDDTNGKQFVTDIYNLLIDPRIAQMYPEIFRKTFAKREETMRAFTTTTGIKLSAGTVGSSQRGDIQEEARPDLIIFDDFETRKTLRSAVITNAIWINMAEGFDGLSGDGGAIYLGNYLSEMGNVHKLVENRTKEDLYLNVPIVTEDGEITWKAKYTKEDIEYKRKKSEDFEGEYLGKPSASKDIYFDREVLDKMIPKKVIKDIAGFKMFKEYNRLHRYGGGMDVAGGVGLDSSTSVFIDFDTIPAQVAATFAMNTILPEAFGDEIYSQANKFGGCIIAPENNKYDQTVLKAKQLGAKMYMSTTGKTINSNFLLPKVYGWATNSLTKSKMLSDMREAIESGLIELNDKDLINEFKSYTRNDLIDNSPDVRLTTRHWDLLTACCIAWQMKDHARPAKKLNQSIISKPTNEINPAE